MGTEMTVDNGSVAGSLESRPGVFLIGPPNVGKRTLLSRLLSVDIPDTTDLLSGIHCQGWTIETKYYSADISIWTTHLDKGLSFGALPFSKQLDALVMVFDMSDESSFIALQDWADGIDTKKFEILLCVGNKADLIPGHSAHVEYRRHMKKRGESTSDPHPEYLNYGIDETEACSFLGDDEPLLDIRKSCLEWCSNHNIEFIEACASNSEFDKCLSADGDIQGVERIYGAISAHMWPGMILKSGNMITSSYLADKEETTDDESDYEFEYEVLSPGLDEQWNHTGSSGVPFNDPTVLNMEKKSVEDQNESSIGQRYAIGGGEAIDDLSNSEDAVAESSIRPNDATVGDPDIEEPDVDEDAHVGFDDVERLMGEISNMRGSLRLMPDFQRREMAAKLAMKMAAMFGDDSEEDML